MITLDRNIVCKSSNGKNAIIVGNSINEMGAYNSKRAMEIEAPVCLRGGKFDIGFIGAYTYINENAIIRNVDRIGRYTQIGLNVVIGMPLVNEQFICLNPTFGPYRNAMFSEFSNIAYTDQWLAHMKQQVKKHSFKKDSNTIIGNDVYIGDGVVIKKGCNIGDGAYILPGSYVCNDVEAYAIVGGTPARVIKYRFDDNLIEKLLKLRWWEYTPSFVSDLDYTKPNEFIEDFEKKLNMENIDTYVCERFVFNPLEKSITRINTDGSQNLIYKGW